MHRVLATFLLALALLAPTASSGEPRQPSPIDPAEVGRLLLSKDQAERDRGTRLLHVRIQRGGNLKAFLSAMAKAQAEWADAEERLVQRLVHEALHGTSEQKDRAHRVLEALGEHAMDALLVRRAREQKDAQTAKMPRTPSGPTPVEPAPTAAVPVPDRASGDAAAPPPTSPAGDPIETPAEPESAQTRDEGITELEAAPLVRLVFDVIEVPAAEVETWLHEEKDGAGTHEALKPVGHGQTVVLGREGQIALERAETLPEARARHVVPGTRVAVGRVVDLVPGTSVRYRRNVTRAGKGGWGVERDELRRGLSVTARVEPRATGLLGGLPYQLVLEVRHTSVPLPMRVETVRPASNVEPLELDRPEWQTAATVVQAEIAMAGDGVVAFVPGVVPDKVVVVGVRLLPFGTPQAAAREQER